VAEKLHTQYNFSYDNLKVLLGGWHSWQQENAKDPNAYPVDVNPTTPAAGGTSDQPALQLTVQPAKTP
jgi:hypothetical protein